MTSYEVYHRLNEVASLSHPGEKNSVQQVCRCFYSLIDGSLTVSGIGYKITSSIHGFMGISSLILFVLKIKAVQ